MDERTPANKPCPCCGGEAKLGLFTYRPSIELPSPVQLAVEKGYFRAPEKAEAVSFFGRSFFSAECALPLGKAESPVRTRLWVEVSEETAVQLQQTRLGTPLSGIGWLACDFPGFPGSIGSMIRFRQRGTAALEIVGCGDGRIAGLPLDPDHEQMAWIYRTVWGNPDPVVDADVELRHAVKDSWRRIVGRNGYSKPIEPPRSLAGITPAEMMVCPPVDTGDTVFMGTVGCSEVNVEGVAPAEIGAWIRNPSDAFLESFSEFAYVSRLNDNPVRSAQIIPDSKTIPDSERRLVAWILCEPWWCEGEETSLDYKGEEVQLLAAIPIYELEMMFAGAFGVDTLLEMMRGSDEDLASLNRGLAVPPPMNPSGV